MPRGRIRYRDGESTYEIDGKIVSRAQWDKTFPSKIGDKFGMPRFTMDQDWSAENGGRGREISQLRDSPVAPKVYARNPNEAAEICRRKNRKFERA